jgi:hypothetical protein
VVCRVLVRDAVDAHQLDQVALLRRKGADRLPDLVEGDPRDLRWRDDAVVFVQFDLRASVAAPAFGEEQVLQDRHEPGVQVGARLEFVGVPQRTFQAVLHQILGGRMLAR